MVGDYSPFVTDIMTSNNGQPPDVAFVVTSFTNVLGLSKALLEAGLQGHPHERGGLRPARSSRRPGPDACSRSSRCRSRHADNPNMQKIVDDIVKK